jgi:hypothetical protein
MSRTNMALLMRVLLTASQVLTVDSKIANVEANIFNFLAVDGFEVAGSALVLAPWYHFQASCFADRGWFLCSGALLVDGLLRSRGGRKSFYACRLDSSCDWIEATRGPWEFTLHLWHVVLTVQHLERSVAVPSECVRAAL